MEKRVPPATVARLVEACARIHCYGRPSLDSLAEMLQAEPMQCLFMATVCNVCVGGDYGRNAVIAAADALAFALLPPAEIGEGKTKTKTLHLPSTRRMPLTRELTQKAVDCGGTVMMLAVYDLMKFNGRLDALLPLRAVRAGCVSVEAAAAAAVLALETSDPHSTRIKDFPAMFNAFLGDAAAGYWSYDDELLRVAECAGNSNDGSSSDGSAEWSTTVLPVPDPLTIADNEAIVESLNALYEFSLKQHHVRIDLHPLIMLSAYLPTLQWAHTVCGVAQHAKLHDLINANVKPPPGTTWASSVSTIAEWGVTSTRSKDAFIRSWAGEGTAAAPARPALDERTAVVMHTPSTAGEIGLLPDEFANLTIAETMEVVAETVVVAPIAAAVATVATAVTAPVKTVKQVRIPGIKRQHSGRTPLLIPAPIPPPIRGGAR